LQEVDTSRLTDLLHVTVGGQHLTDPRTIEEFG
jgi:hypothetical protein